MGVDVKFYWQKLLQKNKSIALVTKPEEGYFYFYTDDFMRDFNNYTNKGVEFTQPIRHESYGTVSVFKDLYGNLWDLIGPNISN